MKKEVEGFNNMSFVLAILAVLGNAPEAKTEINQSVRSNEELLSCLVNPDSVRQDIFDILENFSVLEKNQFLASLESLDKNEDLRVSFGGKVNKEDEKLSEEDLKKFKKFILELNSSQSELLENIHPKQLKTLKYAMKEVLLELEKGKKEESGIFLHQVIEFLKNFEPLILPIGIILLWSLYHYLKESDKLKSKNLDNKIDFFSYWINLEELDPEKSFIVESEFQILIHPAFGGDESSSGLRDEGISSVIKKQEIFYVKN